MMDPVYLLTHYRLPLISDQLALKILGLSLYSGPMNESELINMCGDSPAQTRSKIQLLFQAGMMQHIEGGKLTLTNVSERLLNQIGISEAAAQALVDLPNVPSWKTSFLQACLQARSQLDRNSTINFIYTFKCSDSIHKRIEEFNSSDLRFAVVVGLDPLARDVGIKEYVEKVIDWHSKRDSSLWLEQGRDWVKHKRTLRNLCKGALDEVKLSDELLEGGHTDAADISKSVYALSLSRMLGAILSEEPDYHLAVRHWQDENFSTYAWKNLQSIDPEASKSAIRIFISYKGGDAPQNPSSELAALLRQVLEKSVSKRTSGPPGVAEAASTSLPQNIPEDDIDTIISRLKVSDSQIRNLNMRIQPKNKMYELKSVAGALANTVNQKVARRGNRRGDSFN